MARTTWNPLSTDEQNQTVFNDPAVEGTLVGVTGTGLISMTAGALDTPAVTLSDRVAADAANLRTQLGVSSASGTSGKLSKFTGANSLGDSLLSESGTVMSLAGTFGIASGSIAANAPVLNLSQTWNNGAVVFTGITLDVTDTASNAASYLMDLKLGGSSRFQLTKSGSITLSSSGSLTIGSGGFFRFGSDVRLYRDAANTLALRDLANAQTLNVYGTADAGLTNYRRLRSTMTTGGAVTIAAEGLGTGATGNTLALSANGTTLVTLSTGITLGGTVFLTEGFVVHFGTTSGNKLGNTTSQKIGFWGSTPVVQQSSTGEIVGFTAGGGTTVTDASTFTGNVGATAYRLSDIVKHLKTIGILAA